MPSNSQRSSRPALAAALSRGTALLLAGGLMAACGAGSDDATGSDGAAGAQDEPTTVPESAGAETTATLGESTTAPTAPPTEQLQSQDPEVSQTAEVTISGDLPRMPRSGVMADSDDPANGEVAPTLTGTDFAGQDVVIEPDGRAKVIYFIAHWCPHCQEEVPKVQELIDAGALPAGVDVYAVSTTTDRTRGNYPPSAWLGGVGFSPPVLRDDDNNRSLVAFGAGAFPFAVYLDADHRVVARSSGTLDTDTMRQLWSSLGS